MTDDLSGMVSFQGVVSEVPAYLARPQTSEPRPAVIVIHEIYGLVDHTKDVANRFAREGYVALAPSLFARPELAKDMAPGNVAVAMQTMAALPPEKRSDPEAMQQALGSLPPEKRAQIQQTMRLTSGGIPKESLTQDLVKGVEYLRAQDFVRSDKIASVGFCFGGGMSINLACHTPLAACVIFYGENPSPVELVENIAGPVLGIYGADDLRINQNLDKLVAAMVRYKKDFEMRIYPGAAHAFFNDTNPRTYREGPAREAWERVLRFYRRTLQETS
ncbi:MAG: dienelactone hydrolase family protein [Chloroflexi bacterium]|nr:dienelactone hydrolase family protein [Chloroflexota bacterium]